uniref:Uncharacterized protein n=1 Tax=Timema shepardi TaxID=629360 RepID=A0A7R9AQI0_TIMSH|nr:unnamed protein product [Timema shepardi]
MPNYIGFIKKVMKLLQHGYSSLKKVEVTLTQLDEVETPPNRPSRLDAVLITLGTHYRADSDWAKTRLGYELGSSCVAQFMDWTSLDPVRQMDK